MTTYDRFQGRAALRPAIDYSEPKPLLRGWSHALAALAAVVFTAAMLARASDTARLIGALVFGLSMILLYSVSALYHRYHWEGREFKLLTALDHANIFIMIAGTYTPFCLLVLGGLGITLLAVVWLLASAGMCGCSHAVHLPRWATVAQYIGLGSIALAILPSLAAALPPQAIGTLLLGGGVYALGGLVYALRWPDPLPDVFGFHEIFHLLVVAGNICTAAVVWLWVL
ncbi:MAG TPA: hemolysin III family protein [Roseiflexaceae bacterium]|nr:hemolysin III family protein [Roseiflexaceae bacterium]